MHICRGVCVHIVAYMYGHVNVHICMYENMYAYKHVGQHDLFHCVLGYYPQSINL